LSGADIAAAPLWVLAMRHGKIDTARIAILMCTKNGAAFLADQLQSIADQTHENWVLMVSDDGSTDGTKAILERFAGIQAHQSIIRSGPGRGVCANFLSLATDPSIEADYFAFSDQDDIWRQDKLRRALTWLGTVPNETPALYCGRTELISFDGKSYGLSPLFTRPPAFRNALVQNLAGGNTMVFNRAAKRIVETAGTSEVVLHDWWLYQLVSAAGGLVLYDPQPMIKYRQHPDSLIGSYRGWRARAARIRRTIDGRFHDWNEAHITALRRLANDLILRSNRDVVELFAQARSASLLKRLGYLKKSGVYRQTRLGNLALVAATIMKRI
jgi:glycosyltransferase involved in cell wall biosynthesis